MLVLDSDYQNAIQTLRYNWDAFPLTYLATWGSPVTFGSAIQDITFKETLILDVINTDHTKPAGLMSSTDESSISSRTKTAGLVESNVNGNSQI